MFEGHVVALSILPCNFSLDWRVTNLLSTKWASFTSTYGVVTSHSLSEEEGSSDTVYHWLLVWADHINISYVAISF